MNQIRSAPEGVARTGIEERISLLDKQILQMETQIMNIGQQLAGAPTNLTLFTESPDRKYENGWEDGMGAGIGMSTAFLAAVLLYRWIRGRKKRKNRGPAQVEATDSPRLQRLEQGMEAIAIEIERISEGQRFVTRLLSESRDPAGARIKSPDAITSERT